MQTIGERLEEARKRKGVSIREAAEATKIRGDYLHKFENNQFDIKLPEIYVRGFLRTYALFLKLPGDKIINDYKGLGLGESKARGLNRESFGRMDLSVSTAKSATRESVPGGASPGATEGAVEGGPVDNNPATFRPRAGAGPQIDRALLLKGGLALGALVLLVVMVFVGIRVFSSDKSGPSSGSGSNAASGAQVAVEPAPGEPTITVYALQAVSVTVTQAEGRKVLFKGRLSGGEVRVVPHRGQLQVEANPPEAIELDGKVFSGRTPMPMNNGVRARKADIIAPP
ncbi:MAG: helix-turn-helix domain-containing protein [Opitutaceae bacterium]|nr:helix-turn-helix domain-containing protein [Opitutaceae bacterium]